MKNGTYYIKRDDIFIPMDAPKKKMGRPKKEVK
jgi:hypothetical protein